MSGVIDQITVMTPALMLANPENQSDVINKYSPMKFIRQNRINPIKFFFFICPSFTKFQSTQNFPFGLKEFIEL